MGSSSLAESARWDPDRRQSTETDSPHRTIRRFPCSWGNGGTLVEASLDWLSRTRPRLSRFGPTPGLPGVPAMALVQWVTEQTMIANVSPVLKSCSVCGKTVPVGAFAARADRRSGRRGECRGCWAGRIRWYRSRRRSQAIHRLLRDVADSTSDARAARLIRSHARRFGPVRLSNLVFEHVVCLAAVKPGSRKFWGAARGLHRLLHVGRPCKPSRPTVRRSSAAGLPLRSDADHAC